MKRVAFLSVVLLVAPCASPAPSAATVRFDGWTATCADVPADECQGVAALFVNNLARSGKSVLDESGGKIQVTSRPQCPAVPDWADPGLCWQATAQVAAGPVCMVIARHPRADGAVSTFGQVGGDEMTGRAGPPPSGWPTCE